jgi:hypothetical protein
MDWSTHGGGRQTTARRPAIEGGCGAMLRQFHGTPFEPDLRQAIAKLADMLPDSVTVRLDSIGDFLSVLPAVEAEYDPE